MSRPFGPRPATPAATRANEFPPQAGKTAPANVTHRQQILAGKESRPAPGSPDSPEVLIYTDGGAEPNPGRGGYGVVLLYGPSRKELSAGFRWTTNNRMELLAAIRGLEALKKPCHVTLWTDSTYLRNGIEKGWAKRWHARGWRLRTGEPARNSDLWQRLLGLCATHRVQLRWLRGHCGHPDNERCDQLAAAARQGHNLGEDIGFTPDLPPAEGRFRGPGPAEPTNDTTRPTPD